MFVDLCALSEAAENMKRLECGYVLCGLAIGAAVDEEETAAAADKPAHVDSWGSLQ